MSGKVLITGSTGYLGGRLTEFLSRQGRDVVRGTRDRFDFSRPEEVLAADLSGIEWVVHLAASNDKQCRENPLLASKINVLGTQALLEASVRSGVKRFIYLSTAHIYGAPLEGRLSEETLPKPSHPYGITHLAAEEFVLVAHRTRKIEGIVLRLSNVIGAPQSASADCWMLLPHDLSRQAVQTGSLTLKGAGLQQRDFLPMRDFLDALLFFLKADSARLGDGLFNLGSGHSSTIREVAEAIQAQASRLLSKDVSLSLPAPGPTDRPTSLTYDIQKLKSAGFSPRIALSEALDELLRFSIENFK